jgi:hypothetical protein
MLLTPYALDRLAEDRAEELRRLAAATRVVNDSPLLPKFRHAAGRALVGLGQRMLHGRPAARHAGSA